MKHKTLILITVLGILLRMLFLFHHDIWFDEAISILLARLPINKLLLAASFDNNPPLYYLILHFWMKISENPLWFRSLSLIFSVTTIPIAYLLAKTLINQRIATLTALLTAIMPVQLYYSGEVRFYALLILLSTILFYQVNQTTRKINQKKHFLIVALITAALLYTHYSSIFIITAALLLSTKKSHKVQKIWLKGTIIGFFLAAPWFCYTVGKPHPQPWYPNSLLSVLFLPIASTIGLTGTASPSILTQVPLITTLIISGVALIFAMSLLSQLKTRSLKVLTLLFVGLIIAIAYKVPFLSPRIIIPFTPLLYVWMAKVLNRKPKLRTTFLTLIIAALPLSFSSPLRGPQLKKALNIAEEKGSPNLHTAIRTYYPAILINPTLHYYIGPKTFPLPLTEIIDGTPKEIEKFASKPQLVLLIDENNTDPKLQNAISKQLEKTHKQSAKESIDNFLIQSYTLYPMPYALNPCLAGRRAKPLAVSY